MSRNPYAISIALLGLYACVPPVLRAQNTVYFSLSDPGQSKSVAEWGIDTAWPNPDNVRISIASMGINNIDVVRLNFYADQPLLLNPDNTYSLNAAAKSAIDSQLALAATAGATKPLALVPGGSGIDPMYRSGTGINPSNWAQMIKTTQEYINSKSGFTTTQIRSIEPFNEPDWSVQGSAAQLNSVITQLRTYSVFQNTAMVAPSTLNSDTAQGWYDQVPAATAGSSHLLGGSLSSWVNFIEHVKSTGKAFNNPELHSMGEMIVGAEHGMTRGITWADIGRGRGLFMQASDGKRLGYFQDLGRQSAAAVYRGPNGKIYAFAGGLERFGSPTSYRFVSTDAASVYFNGIPVREYMLQTKRDDIVSDTDNDFQRYGSWSSQGAYADIETAPTLPALDGYRWKIVNRQSGQVMQVAGAGTGDGALINSAADTGALNQMWNVVRTRNGYYELFNANSGRTAEVANGALANGASVRQWGTADNQIQQWYLEPASNGYFFIRNAFSNKYLTGSATNSVQWDPLATFAQQWQFVGSNPSTGARAQFNFEGTVSDNTGHNNNGTAFGSPTFTAGPPGQGQAISLNGTTGYVQLPGGVASGSDITIAADVKWNGGNAWQRVFDFGNNTTSYLFLTPRSGADTMRFAITTAGPGAEQTLDTDPLPTGQWVHLAITIGGNTGILYVNGRPRVAGQILLNPSDVSSTLNYIGKSQFSADPLLSGSIDDFRIYDYALDPSQMANLVPRRWTGALSSNWTTATLSNPKNWQILGNSADYTDGDVVLFDDNAVSFTVNLADSLIDPGNVIFDNSAHSYVLNGPGNIGGSGALTKNGAALLTINSLNTYTGGTTVNAGTLIANRLANGSLTINGGVARVSAKAFANDPAGTSVVPALNIATAAQLDLTNNSMVIDYSGSVGTLAADVRQHLQSGRLLSSSADANRKLGYADNAALGLTSFAGRSVDASSMLIKFTYAGDANLDGQVDVTDLGALATNWQTNNVWTGGDFNYDGFVDVTDLGALATNWQFGVGSPLDFGELSRAAPSRLDEALAAVGLVAINIPEPGALGLSLLASMSLSLRSRRR